MTRRRRRVTLRRMDDAAVTGQPEPTSPAQRWLARLAFLVAAVAVVLPLVAAGPRESVAMIIVGIVGAGLTLAAGWWFLTHRGVVRVVAGILAVAAPVTVAVLYAGRGLLWIAVVTPLVVVVALAIGRAALAAPGDGPREYETPPPRRPFLIMNPRSGGGKVERFGLVDRARALGAEVAVLDGPGMVDVAALARKAVRDGADLLGVAGGDGTQALVAGIAAEHDLPFMVISAGTRNHFALDLGLDRQDPSTSLDALTDGVELRIDLGQIGDRTFVNNASFGAYAAVVQSPAYRDDKAGTTLDLLPDLLTDRRGPALRPAGRRHRPPWTAGDPGEQQPVRRGRHRGPRPPSPPRPGRPRRLRGHRAGRHGRGPPAARAAVQDARAC